MPGGGIKATLWQFPARGVFPGAGCSAECPTEGNEFLPPQPDDCRPVQPTQFGQRFGDRLPGGVNGGGGIAMRTAGRLRHDLVDDAEANKILGGNFQARCGVLGLAGIVPEN